MNSLSPDSCNTECFEKQRQSFKPEKITLLFIAESRPQNGTFFYFRNSNIYRELQDAYCRIYPHLNDMNFLEEFKEKGCYIEDLCLNPVNGLDSMERCQARIEGIPLLANRLKFQQPKAILTIGKDIFPFVEKAVRESNIKPLFHDQA